MLSVRSFTVRRTLIEFMRTTSSSPFSASNYSTPFLEGHSKPTLPRADILPLRPGHTLIVPKIHCSRVSELPPEYAAALGKAISRISKALTKGAPLPNRDPSASAVTLTINHWDL